VGQTAILQAGGGLVADLDPANEYQECINKARGSGAGDRNWPKSAWK